MRGRPGDGALWLLALAVALGAAGGTGVAEHLTGRDGASPAFVRRQRTGVRARPGAAAALRCRVLRLADRAVSWVRSSDLQILTHAGAVFTADTRVSAITGAAADRGGEGERDESDDDDPDYAEVRWPEDAEVPEGEREAAMRERADETVHTLYIERLRSSDSGRYECQINTEPKMSLFFNLTVTDAQSPAVTVRALGTRAVRGELGGSAALACEARYQQSAADLPPLRIRWYHAGRLLDDQSPPGGVSLSAERWSGGARSRLMLGALRRRHAGAWTCRAGGTADTLTLTLVARSHADELESMQRDQAVARVGAASPAPPRPLAALLSPALLAAVLAALVPT